MPEILASGGGKAVSMGFHAVKARRLNNPLHHMGRMHDAHMVGDTGNGTVKITEHISVVKAQNGLSGLKRSGAKVVIDDGMKARSNQMLSLKEDAECLGGIWGKQRLEHIAGHVGGMLYKGKIDVDGMAIGRDIAQLRPDRDTIEGRMGLDLAAMALLLKRGHGIGHIADIDVDPGVRRPALRVNIWIARNQHRQNALQPGGARLWRCVQNDVVRARQVLIPTRRVPDRSRIGAAGWGW